MSLLLLLNAAPVSVSVTPGAGALALTGYAPAVTATSNVTATPGAASLALTGFAPTITATSSASVEPGAGQLTLLGYAPTITATSNASAAPGTGQLILLGYAPTVTASTPSALGGGGMSARSPAYEWELELAQAARLAAITKELARSEQPQARKIARKIEDYSGDIRQLESLNRDIARLEAIQRDQLERTIEQEAQDARLRVAINELNDILLEEADAINAIIALEEFEATFLLSALGLKIQ